jgi:hypothetical protein
MQAIIIRLHWFKIVKFYKLGKPVGPCWSCGEDRERPNLPFTVHGCRKLIFVAAWIRIRRDSLKKACGLLAAEKAFSLPERPFNIS